MAQPDPDLLNDAAFDRFLPEPLHRVSAQFWTPLPVIRRLAQWIDELEVGCLVDIGSGAGKVCVAGALLCRARFVGLEQRPHLVAASRALASVFGVEDRAQFVEGRLGEDPVPQGDAYYLFNPFEENLHGPEDHIDEGGGLAPERYLRDVVATERLLMSAPPGTCFFAYVGFGGVITNNYDLVREDQTLQHPLRAWRKADRPATSVLYVTAED